MEKGEFHHVKDEGGGSASINGIRFDLGGYARGDE